MADAQAEPREDSTVEAITERYEVHAVVYERPMHHATCWMEYRTEGRCKCDAEADIAVLLATVQRLTRDLAERDQAIARLMDANGSLTRDLEAAQQDRDHYKTKVDDLLVAQSIIGRDLAKERECSRYQSDAFDQRIAEVRAELEAARQQIAEEKAKHQLTFDTLMAMRDDARARLAAAEQLRDVVKKHYPSIAGHVIRLYDAGEDRAGMEWADVARDFHAALATFDAATVGQAP